MENKNYLFKSERLGFRNWEQADLEEFVKLNADEKVMEHFPKTLSLDEVRKLVEKLKNKFETFRFTYYVTEVLATNEFIGMIGMAYQVFPSAYTPAVDIGWRLKRSAWGKGYATEGAKRCLNHGFSKFDMDRIISICTLKNTKSENVMKKIGMTKIGEFNYPDMKQNPEYEAHFCYEISRNSFSANII